MKKNIQQLTSTTVYDVDGNVAFRCVLKQRSGREVAKTISSKDYVNMIAGSTVISGEMPYVRLGKLPKGFIDGAISDNGIKAFIEVPEKVRCIRYFDANNMFLVPFPRLMFELEAVNGRFLGGYVYAVKGTKPIVDKTELYQYPFGNVSTSGHICFGNIFAQEVVVVEKFIDFEKVIERFFSAITNDDYWGKKNRIKSGKYETQRDFLKFLEGKAKYPSKELVAVGESAGEIINSAFSD